MRNKKKTILHSPDDGVHLFKYVPSGLEFGIESYYPLDFLKEEYFSFPNQTDRDALHHPDHLTVLEDFKIIATLNREEFVFRLRCPGQMKRMLAFIKEYTCFEDPEIVVTSDFFYHLYGITD